MSPLLDFAPFSAAPPIAGGLPISRHGSTPISALGQKKLADQGMGDIPFSLQDTVKGPNAVVRDTASPPP
jgi:hypothetical protein